MLFRSANRTKVLQNLATALGFTSNKELADEILALPAPTVAKEKPGTAKKESSVGKKRKRHQLTDEIRSRAIALLKQKKTALAVAKEIGISVPSVSKIKKAAGLTVSRDAVKAATAPKSKAKKAGAGKPAAAAAPGG